MDFNAVDASMNTSLVTARDNNQKLTGLRFLLSVKRKANSHVQVFFESELTAFLTAPDPNRSLISSTAL